MAVVATGQDREYITVPDWFMVVACTDCGLVRLNPRPQQSELGRIYPSVYHSYTIDKGFIPWLRKRAGAHRMRKVLRHLKEHRTIRMLDVGCGNGWLLDVFMMLDPRIRTTGVEIDTEACDAARLMGHKVYEGRFEDVDLDAFGLSFDLINMTHVIEHLSDPKGAVAKAAALLNPNGILVLETPNIGSWEYPRFKAIWGAYHIPRHWTFYDRRSITTLGEGAGLKLVDWYCHPGPTHWVWTFHNIALEHRGLLPVWLEWLCDPIAIFKGSVRSAIMLAAFWCLDRFMLACGRQTSVMTAVFRKGGAMSKEKEYLGIAEAHKRALRLLVEAGAQQFGVAIEMPELNFDSGGDWGTLMARLAIVREEIARIPQPKRPKDYPAWAKQHAARDWRLTCESVALAKRLVEIGAHDA